MTLSTIAPWLLAIVGTPIGLLALWAFGPRKKKNTAPDFLQQPTTPAAAKAHHRKDQSASGITDDIRLRMVSNGARQPNYAALGLGSADECEGRN